MKIETRSIGKGKHAVTLKRDDGGIAWADELTPANAAQRKRFIEGAREKLPGLEPEALEAQLLELADRPEPEDDGEDEIPEDPPEVRAEALEMLGSGDLMDQIHADLDACGLACDHDLGLILHLAMTSRLLGRPVSTFTQGPSCTGKTFACNVAASLIPPEDVVNVQDVTPQVLYHMGDRLKHRVLIQGEWCRSDEQSENGIRTQAMRQLISDGRLGKLFTNTETGKPTAEEARTEGPVAVHATSTLEMSKIFEEDENRFLIVHSDETEAATKLALRRQADTFAGIRQASDERLERIRRRHHTMQREIRRQGCPAAMVIPFAPRIGDLFPSDQPRRRRDLPKLLGLISASALLHFRQRTRDPEGRIVAEIEDYRHVHRLLAPYMVKDGPTPAAIRKYDELTAKLDPGQIFRRTDVEEICGVRKARAAELIRELRDARLLKDAGSGDYSYQLLARTGERTTFLPDPSVVADSCMECV